MSENQNTNEDAPNRGKYQRTSEQRASDRAIREEARRGKPTVADLLADPEVEGPFQHGYITTLLHWVGRLRPLREAAGLTLAQVSEKTGIDVAALSRLENGHTPNPTLYTLWRYAEALGHQIDLILVPEPEATPAS